jgi:hypothetical protein
LGLMLAGVGFDPGKKVGVGRGVARTS